jgi:protein-arginine kinase activator protein McsA
MITTFPTIYHDKYGTITTIIENDGKALSMLLRDVEFTGSMFDDFEPKKQNNAELNSFTINNGSLCSCELECKIPIILKVEGIENESVLHTYIELGGACSNGGLEYEKFELELYIENKLYRSSGENEWFEDSLWEVQNQLPDHISIKSCYTCAYSAYHPAGYGAFGCLGCFRNHKQEILDVQTKDQLMNLYDDQVEKVQETWFCTDYENREELLGSNKRLRP